MKKQDQKGKKNLKIRESDLEKLLNCQKPYYYYHYLFFFFNDTACVFQISTQFEPNFVSNTVSNFQSYSQRFHKQRKKISSE